MWAGSICRFGPLVTSLRMTVWKLQGKNTDLSEAEERKSKRESETEDFSRMTAFPICEGTALLAKHLRVTIAPWSILSGSRLCFCVISSGNLTLCSSPLAAMIWKMSPGRRPSETQHFIHGFSFLWRSLLFCLLNSALRVVPLPSSSCIFHDRRVV